MKKKFTSIQFVIWDSVIGSLHMHFPRFDGYRQKYLISDGVMRHPRYVFLIRP